jgi:serine/threonine protein kinase/Tfp pilus assembly protein PilF
VVTPPKPIAGWEDLFDELVELPLSKRTGRLREIAAGDPTLAARLERLLAADDAPGDFLERPAMDLVTTVEGSVTEADDQLAGGTLVGPWRILRLIGRGGMGEVYLAERDEPSFTQLAAVKIVKRGLDSPTTIPRFLRERQILAALDHPNLAHLLDGGTAPDGRPYFALEWVQGESITSYCREHVVDLETMLRLMQTVCQAVDSAHRRLVVHRDLKPANILVTPEGTPKLLDFGIAQVIAEGSADEGRIGMRALTPAYAAPEQILGEPITTATDVYSLGVLLFELITRTLPHRRSNSSLSTLAEGVDTETVERPSIVLRKPTGNALLARRVSGDLDLIVLKALQRDPAQRYASAQALADDIARLLDGRPVKAHADQLGYRIRRFVLRHRIPMSAVALGLVALIAGLGVSLWQARESRFAAQRAAAAANRAERVKSFLVSIFRQSDPELREGPNLTARELLERGASQLDKGLTGEPEVQADLFEAVARIENNLGLMDQAFVHAKRSLELRRSFLPPTDGHIGVSLTVLGEVQNFRGSVEDARKSFESALRILQPAYGSDSVEVAEAQRGLAEVLHAPEESARSVELLRRAFATFSHRSGDSDSETADTLHELGLALESNQQYPAAEVADRRATSLLVKALGPHSAKVAEAQADLAGLLDRLGKAKEAQALFEQALATQRAVFGPHHLKLADTLFSYAILLIEQQQHAAANAALTEAIGIYGLEREETGHCLRYLGISAMQQEHYAEAARLFARAAEIYKTTIGVDSVQRYRALANLGWADFHLGRLPEAKSELSSAMANIQRLSGPDAYEIRLPLKQLGEVLAASGSLNEGIALLRRARALEEKLFHTIDHREVGGSDLLVGRSLLRRAGPGDLREARRVIDEGLNIFHKVNPQDVLNGECLLESGKLAIAEGDAARAQRDLAAAEPLLVATKGAEHAETRSVRTMLAALAKGARSSPGAGSASPARIP